MKIAPFLLCAQISCALVAALDGILSEGVKVSELFDRSELAAENGYQVGHGQKGLPKRLWRREDQQSQVEKRSVETEQNDALTEGAKDKWTSFSEGLNTRERWVEVEKRSGGVFKRNDQATASVIIGNLNITEEHLLALIVGDQYDKDDQCQKLQKYCTGLGTNGISEEMDPLVKGICQKDNGKDKCNELKKNVEEKCNALKTAFQTLEKKFQEPSKLEDKDCSDNEPQCSFLDGTDDELKLKCNKLRNACYRKKRDKVAEEVLMRVLSGDLKQNGDVECKKKLEEQCPLLGLQSDELFQKCLDPQGTCTDLKGKAKAKCTNLKTNVDGALQKTSGWEDKCHSLLEECHFYSSNCNENDKPKCDELIKDCKEKNFIYTPPGSIINPIEQAPGLLDRIDLDALYKKSAEDGAFIGKRKELSQEDFLILITPKDDNDGSKCKEELKKKCKNYKSFSGKIKGLCQGDQASNDGDTACQLLQNNIKNKCGSLKSRLKGDGVLDGDKNKIYTWKELERIYYLRERDCEYLESQCLYLENHCESHDLGKGCHNLRAVCYKRALNDLAYVELQKRLRGELSSANSTGEPTHDQKKKLLVSCQELRNQSIELFQLCMDPENTLKSLEIDIHEKARILKPALDHRRDFPDERDCVELKKQCEHLEKDSYLVEEACHTLRTRCHFRSLSEDLKLRLLEERKEMFKKNTTCINELEKKCDLWHKKKDKKYAFPCSLPEDSCKLMMWRVGEHCGALDANLESYKVIDNVTRDDANGYEKKEKICLGWMPYCYNLMPNCDELVIKKKGKQNEDGLCKKLKEKCDPIIERWNNQGWLMYQLRGNLTNDQCKNNLDNLCLDWGKGQNKTLSSFCKDTSKDENAYRTKLCDKLKKRIKEKCPVLKTKLEKAKGEVEKKAGEYEKLKEETEKAIKSAKLNVTEQLQQKAEKTNLLRRDPKDSSVAAPASVSSSKKSLKVEVTAIPITKQHAEAIELLSQALDLYFDLKEECDKLTSDCDFQKDCECESSCSKILAACKEVKPLTIAQPRIIEEELKPETGKESKSPSEEKGGEKQDKPSKPAPGGAGEGKNCTSIKTSDTWVTSTSTHTTTITSTSTKTLKVTLTSTRKCKPTKCTTGKGEPTSKSDEEEVVPSGGKRWLPSVGIAIVGVVVAIM